jgi:hypothetical protein
LSTPLQSYPDQCVGRAAIRQAMLNNCGAPGWSVDAGLGAGGAAASCPTPEELLQTCVYPDSLGLQGSVYQAGPTYDVVTDRCCYTTRTEYSL